MKNNLIGLLLILFIVVFTTACEDNFDIDEAGGALSKKEVFEDYNRTKGFLVNLYSHLPSGLNDCEDRMFAAACDDATTVYLSEGVNDFTNGNWSPVNTKNDVWEHYYKAIRQCNIFIDATPGLTFERIANDQDYTDKMKSFAFFNDEARFLRAYYYFELLKRYGGTPLVLKPLTREEANKVTRASYSKVLSFIITELDAVKDELANDYQQVFGNLTGRATRGACYALKSRVLLYAASPLWNESNDVAKWKLAADACNDLIGLAKYDIEASYLDAFNNLASSELIFERRHSLTNDPEKTSYPVGKFFGAGSNTPTQNLVDCYEMQSTGLAISDPASGYDANNPYDGRDPRFYASIFYNQSLLDDKAINLYEYGEQGYNRLNGSRTGYYLKKTLRTDVTLYPNEVTKQRHVFPLFRFAEVILNYAEAMNEAYGPNDNQGKTYTALEAVNYLRVKRQMPVFPSDLSKDDFRERLRNERRVELAFENHRFFDIRRWKIGKSQDIFGVKGKKSGDSYTYEKYVVKKTVWDDKFYLYPISQKERLINSNLDQNKLW